jgi:CRISPR-associated protein Cas2
MAMTVVVTRDVPERFRGFLASCMLEIAPGVYTSPKISKAVRERVWGVLSDWHGETNAGSIVMTWAEKEAEGGQGVEILGAPPVMLVEQDGMILATRGTMNAE